MFLENSHSPLETRDAALDLKRLVKELFQVLLHFVVVDVVVTFGEDDSNQMMFPSNIKPKSEIQRKPS
jgi:hypothetical protein